jgi:hypothetical protein
VNRSSRRVAVAAATVVGSLLLGACGTTTVDTSATTAPAADTAPTTAALAADADLPTLLPLLVSELARLPEQVVDNEGDEDTLARLERVWDLAEPQVRVDRPETLVGFEQAMTLARTAVERRRPADASKGFKIADDLVDQYLG